MKVTAPAGAGGGGSGTVTSLTATAPVVVTPSPTTATGVISAPTAVTSTSPGVGIAHFAGATQDVTSSAVNLASADVTGVLASANGGVNNVVTAGQGYLIFPNTGDLLQYNGTTSNGGVGGVVRCGLMMVDRSITFTKMTINTISVTNGSKIYLGIYNAAGTTLIRQGTITMTASTGIYTAAVASTTLTPGAYWWAFSTDNVTVTMTGNAAANATTLTIFNANNVAWGFCANALSGSTLPASLGAVTSNAAVLPMVKLEP